MEAEAELTCARKPEDEDVAELADLLDADDESSRPFERGITNNEPPSLN